MATFGLPSFPSFNVNDGNAGPRWKKWLARFERLLVALDIDDPARMRALLLHYAGPEVDEIFDTFHDGGLDDDFNAAKARLTEYFSPIVNTAFELYNFRNAKQMKDESLDAYCTRLRQLAATCAFTDTNKEIAAHIILTCTSHSLRRKALRENLNLKDLLTAGRSFELSETQASNVEKSDHHINAVSNGAYSRSRPRRKGHHHDSRNRSKSRDHSRQKNKYQGQNQNQPGQSKSCYFCGGKYPHGGQCPAKGKKCDNCGIMNHFSRVCHSAQKGGNRVQQVQDEPINRHDSPDDDDYLYSIQDKQNQGQVNATRTYGKKRGAIRHIKVSGKEIPIMIDSGATVDIMDQETYDSMRKEGYIRGALKDSTRKLYPYGVDIQLPVIGVATLPVVYENTTLNCDFHVVRGRRGNLLSLQSAEEIGILHIAYSIQYQKITEDTELFTGIGKIKDRLIKLHVDESVAPSRQPHRRIPFHIRKDVEAELKRLEDLDIIEKVDGPTPWVSPIVTVPKKSGGVRICVDMREANKAILREKHITPTLDDLIADLNGATVFSKLDLRAGYHQLELHPDSRYLTTFSTHAGLRRYKRLSFGINAASEIFQNAIAEIIQDIPDSKNISDDIIVYGKTQTQHDNALERVLKTLKENGITLNQSKCEFSKSEIVFYGHIFSKNGLSADPEKIKTIVDAAEPTSPSEVKSLLGMAQYVSRFIPNYADITEPLRRLTRKDSSWKWEAAEKKSFTNLKTALSSAEVMGYFDPRKETELIVDASPTGLGAILTQDGKVLSYASRALSDVESRYSQTEREMLAVVWSAEHYHLYTYGGTFQIITDHKPLLGIFKSKKPTSVRLERWRIRLMPYNYELLYRPGKDENNPADYISRHPDAKVTFEENIAEDYINYISTNATPKALTLAEIQAETKQDHILQAVIVAVESGKWYNKQLQDYQKVKDEIAVYNGLVLRDHRIVIPYKLRGQAVDLAHVGHQGIVKTKKLMREKVWFPGIDRLIEEKIQKCIPCQSATNTPRRREPLLMSKLPSTPWENLSIDFAGPFPTGDYLLVVIDDYSRYPEVEVIQSTAARSVIPKLDAIFSRQGIPANLKSDNGPPFNGKEFADFANYLGFNHRRITPLWPEANGEAERFMRSLNKCIRAADAERLNWKQELNKFLRQYRATPHSTTGVSPFEALTGRRMKTQLPQLNFQSTRPLDHNIRLADNLQKQKMKNYADERRHTKVPNLTPGDTVLVRQPRINKTTPPFNPQPYRLISTKGSMMTARRGEKEVTRNSSHFKSILSTPSEEEEENENIDIPYADQNVPEINNDIPYAAIQVPVNNADIQVPVNNADPGMQRRSTRVTKPPVRFKDYELCRILC